MLTTRATSWFSDYTGSSTSNFSNATNIKVDDANYAEIVVTAGYGDFSGYVTPDIPSDTIVGIEVEIHAWAQNSSSNNYIDCQLSWNNGSNWTSVKRVPTSGALATSETPYTLGGSADTWGRSWSRSEITTSNFRLKVTGYYDSGSYIRIDFIRWRVHYQSGAVEVKITTNTDDGEESGGTYSDTPTGNTIGVGSGLYGAFRFQNITIPKNVGINSAKIWLCPSATSGTQMNYTKIRAVDVDDFAGFDNSSNKPSTLWGSSATTAGGDWDFNSTTQNYYQVSGDFSSVIQEIIDRAGWVSGNDIGIMIGNDGSSTYYDFYDYNYNSGLKVAYLVIDYSPQATITAKARIKRTQSKTIQAKAFIITGNEIGKIIDAKASIRRFKITQLVDMLVGGGWNGGGAGSYTNREEIQAHIDADAYDGNVKFYFEADIVGGSAGTSYAQLYNKTGSEVVSGSEVSTTDIDNVQRVRSGAISLSGDKDYYVQLKHSATANACYIYAARIIIIQQGAVTKTQIQIELGNEVSTFSTLDTNVHEMSGFFLYESGKYDGTVTIKHEAVMRATAGNTVYSGLRNVTDGSNVADSVANTNNSSNYTRVSSSNITLIDTKVYRPTMYVSAGGGVTFYNNKIIITITGGFTKFLAYWKVYSSTQAYTNSTEYAYDESKKIQASPLDFEGYSIVYQHEAVLDNDGGPAYISYGRLRNCETNAGAAITEVSNTGTTAGRARSTPGFNLDLDGTLELGIEIKTSNSGGYVDLYHSELVITAQQEIELTKTIQAKASISAGGTYSKTVTAKAKIVCISLPTLIYPEQDQELLNPIMFRFTIPYCCKGKNMAVRLQVDNVSNAFNNIERDVNSYQDAGFQYWDGDSWETYPVEGVSSAYYGNEARVQLSLVNNQAKYWRVRGVAK